MRAKRTVIGVALCIAALCAIVLGADTAFADTVLGSALATGPAVPSLCGGTVCTVYQAAAPSETLTAPAAGTITSWSVRSSEAGARYELRVMRPAGGGFTAVGTSAPQTVADATDSVRGPFPAGLAVQAGDRLAVTVLSGQGAPVSNDITTPLADELNYFSDGFADGASESPALSPPLGGNQELLLQATFHPSDTGGGGGGGGGAGGGGGGGGS